jgi:hypothetical protein
MGSTVRFPRRSDLTAWELLSSSRGAQAFKLKVAGKSIHFLICGSAASRAEVICGCAASRAESLRLSVKEEIHLAATPPEAEPLHF